MFSSVLPTAEVINCNIHYTDKQDHLLIKKAPPAHFLFFYM